ncbi:MAG: hypothetical protein J5809_06945 [Selenomonadaceae bacterium]|nr:hypothetical protein [Selenomonadaceae bacterium]
MDLKTVVKRSGESVDYDRAKIFNAIAGANRDATTPADKLKPDDIERVTAAVETAIGGREKIGVEEIQDEVEKSLMAQGFFDVAKQFILYREKHAQRRNAQKKLMDTYRDIFFAKSVDVDLKRDNANINTDASMGIMLKLGAEGAKYFVDNYVLPEEFAAADKENWIHIHDKDFSLITLNCCQIDLLKLFHGGFSTGHGFLREPNSIRSYAALACIAIQSNQNDQFGGQSINAFDYAMAEGVRKSFKKILSAEILRASEFCDVTPAAEVDFDICTYSEKENPAAVENLTAVVGSRKLAEKIYRQACRDVEEETHQAMEALIHNFNTLHCLPYSERIWVFDTKQNELELTAVGELAEKFEANRYQAISLNKTTGESELKFITAIERKDNRRNLMTLVDNAGRRVTTTDNHKIMYLSNNGKILEDIPADLTSVLAPRKFNGVEVSDKLFINEFKSLKRQNYELPHIAITPEFAKIAGYYVAEGNVSGGSQLVFSVCSSEKEDELISLMKIVYGENVTFNRYARKNGSPHSIHFNVGKVMADAFKNYFGENSHCKKIPLEILFAQDRNVKVNFLNGYLKCDGSIKSRYAGATSVSRLLIKQLHLMLLSLNELSTLNERDTHSAEYGDTHIYEINFCGNAGNRIGLEFNFENVRVEMRRYSYEFLKD